MRGPINSLLTGLFPITALLFGCSESPPTKDDIVRANVEAKLKENMNDPASYEFVSLVLIDSITFGDNAKHRTDYWDDEVNSATREIEQGYKYRDSYAEMGVDPPTSYSPEALVKLEAKLERNREVRNKVNELADGLGSQSEQVASYTYTFKFRGNNALGAKVVNEYFVQTGPPPALEIINMVQEQGKLFLNPGDFPGYRDLVAKYLDN